MKFPCPWIPLVCLLGALSAEELARETESAKGEETLLAAQGQRAPMPWIGLDVAKLDPVTRAHAAKVPDGVGFLVQAVAANGPAKTAGLKKYDVLWRFGDQLLVNEAQFATLLNLRSVGDRVTLSVIRSGEEMEFELELADRPAEPKVAGISAVDLPLIPNGVAGMPQVRVIPHDKTAEMTRSDGSTAKLFFREDEAYITIVGVDQEIIYDGPVRKDGEILVPKEWRMSVGAMKRSLYKAKHPDWMPRRPRPRVVLPSDPAN